MSGRHPHRPELTLPRVQPRWLPRYLLGLRHRLKALLETFQKPRILACGWAVCTLDIHASTSVIHFRGELTTASCRIHALDQANGEGMNMTLDFARVAFEAADGSGLDPDAPSLLALSADSTARGAGIGLWSPVTVTALDLSTRPVLRGLFARVGNESIAQIVVAALYSRTSARPVGGSANAALPVGLSYE